MCVRVLVFLQQEEFYSKKVVQHGITLPDIQLNKTQTITIYEVELWALGTKLMWGDVWKK